MRLVAPALVATQPFHTVGGLRMSRGDELRGASGALSIGRTTAAIVFMALVLSVLATLYPSWRASRLDPVEALRYE